MIRKQLPSLALLMAFLILFSTVGLAVNVHTCEFSGTSNVSVINENNNFHTSSEKVTEKPDSLKTGEEIKCCANEKEHAKVEVEASKGDVEPEDVSPSIISFNLLFEILYRFNFSDLFDFSPSKKNQLQIGAWSSHGQELLKLIKVFIK